MNKLLILALALTTPLWAQQEDKGKKMVESPIKKAIGPAPEKYDLASTGIEWNRGLESAVNKGKPILLFQLLGNFDDVYC
jgi:hypothetical protein